jgi:cytochrome c-type biogenesis protein CcmH/NrfG
VACLEAPYATGLGYAEGGGLESAADAMLTAVKRLDGRPPRLVLVVETAARYEAMGAQAAAEWAAMRSQLDEGTPLVGWLAEQVAGYGRGVQPTDSRQALMVLAIGDSPRS